LVGCFAVAAGCGGDDSAPGGDGDAGLGGDSAACSTTVVVSGCNKVKQNNVEFDLGCSSIVNKPVNGRSVCAVSGQCNNGCLDPATVFNCLQNCRPTTGDGGGDAGSSPLGTTCSSNADCGMGLTCLRSTDNLAPGAGPPNGVCTVDCATKANHDLCDSLSGICIRFSDATTKSFCMESCTTGKVTPQEAKCHGREDEVCAALTSPGLFACIPLCATDADCGGTRKCDLGTGFCSDVVTPGAPIGSPCTLDSDCAGAICYPFDVSPDASSSAGVCSALCRLGNPEGCKFRTTPLDAGPPVGACLLSTSSADIGDTAICAQLCDSVNDCGTVDPRWTCLLDSSVRVAFGHAGYCWLGMRPDGGVRDASAPEAAPPETGAPDTSAPEAGPPDTGTPEATPDVPLESGTDGDASDDAVPPMDGTSD